MKNILKTLLIVMFISISLSSPLKAQQGKISCTLEYSFPPLYLGYVEIGVNLWSCTNGCLYTTTWMRLLTDNSLAILSDVENCN